MCFLLGCRVRGSVSVFLHPPSATPRSICLATPYGSRSNAHQHCCKYHENTESLQFVQRFQLFLAASRGSVVASSVVVSFSPGCIQSTASDNYIFLSTSWRSLLVHKTRNFGWQKFTMAVGDEDGGSEREHQRRARAMAEMPSCPCCSLTDNAEPCDLVQRFPPPPPPTQAHPRVSQRPRTLPGGSLSHHAPGETWPHMGTCEMLMLFATLVDPAARV